MNFCNEFEINNRLISFKEKPFIIAEMACAHNGSINQAKELIDAAINAGADAIQLQFFVADETVTPLHEAYQVINEIEFSPKEWKSLVNYCRKSNISVFACTYDVPSVQLAIETKCDAIKLNSSDLSNPEVLLAVAESKLPITLGTGASKLNEIKTGLKFLSEHGSDKIILMYGVQNFPTEIQDLNILRLDLIKDYFPNIPVGYADHTSGNDIFSQYVDMIAIGKGVCVLEKHITLDRSKKGIDFEAALEPKEFQSYVKRVKKSFKALGLKEYDEFSASDLKYRKFQKKSIVANREINKGEIIDSGCVSFVRNKLPGLAPNLMDLLSGKKAKKKILKYENILLEDVQ